jgi:hypothetical protein
LIRTVVDLRVRKMCILVEKYFPRISGGNFACCFASDFHFFVFTPLLLVQRNFFYGLGWVGRESVRADAPRVKAVHVALREGRRARIVVKRSRYEIYPDRDTGAHEANYSFVKRHRRLWHENERHRERAARRDRATHRLDHESGVAAPVGRVRGEKLEIRRGVRRVGESENTFGGCPDGDAAKIERRRGCANARSY